METKTFLGTLLQGLEEVPDHPQLRQARSVTTDCAQIHLDKANSPWQKNIFSR